MWGVAGKGEAKRGEEWLAGCTPLRPSLVSLYHTVNWLGIVKEERAAHRASLSLGRVSKGGLLSESSILPPLQPFFPLDPSNQPIIPHLHPSTFFSLFHSLSKHQPVILALIFPDSPFLPSSLSPYTRSPIVNMAIGKSFTKFKQVSTSVFLRNPMLLEFTTTSSPPP